MIGHFELVRAIDPQALSKRVEALINDPRNQNIEVQVLPSVPTTQPSSFPMAYIHTAAVMWWTEEDPPVVKVQLPL